MISTTRLAQGLALVSLLLGSAVSVHAQACLGLPALSLAPRSVSAYGAAAGSHRSVLARYGIAGTRAFGGLQAGYGAQEFKKPRTPMVGADLGFVLPLGSSRATALCPVLQSSFERGPDGGSTTQRTMITSLGLALGRAIPVTASFSIAPFVQGGLQLRQDWARFVIPTPLADGTFVGVRSSASHTHSDALVGVGFGLRFGDLLTLTPSARKAIGTDPRFFGIGEPVYSFTASFGFGR
jgi:hypothetical protein